MNIHKPHRDLNMSTALPTEFIGLDKKVLVILVLFIPTIAVLTIVQDILGATLKDTAFFFSESLIFSSFWWIFLPLLFAQYLVIRRNPGGKPLIQIAVILFPVIIHLFAFPLIVWALSKAFYYHAFSYKQTFIYALSSQFYLLLLFYAIPVLISLYLLNKIRNEEWDKDSQVELLTHQFINSLVVSEGNRKLNIDLDEVLFLSANPPYINIHLDSKRYLLNETLKSISQKLNPKQFVRIHKSTLINVKMVSSYRTRRNGDYEIIMKNNTTLRMSRNFASEFKDLFCKTPPLTTK